MTQAKGNPESSFNDENLRLVVADLFSAGMVTTSTTLAWALLLMILHPDVQRESSPGGWWEEDSPRPLSSVGLATSGSSVQGLSPSSDVTAPPPSGRSAARASGGGGSPALGSDHHEDTCFPGRVQQEIDEVIGQVRRPEMGDQALMPFTVAVVHEVQRFADIVPLGLPHMTSRDIEVQGFHVPKVGLRLSQPRLRTTCHLIPQ